jgi:hypothetical protein
LPGWLAIPLIAAAAYGDAFRWVLGAAILAGIPALFLARAETRPAITVHAAGGSSTRYAARAVRGPGRPTRLNAGPPGYAGPPATQAPQATFASPRRG